ncbi:citrulline utilization hydrolase CtlX [Sediminitomix flava]|uniref:Amidinotransferase n=1 Tax=Sediminitomix flava TaxID=379075 RepID=A0A315ZCS6_SEDFL|nr:arginine deiminase-related protein [Sediminitomix flava]PWJ42628.1 hypothetical protein BC781_102172 [Sediminitomix flava]
MRKHSSSHILMVRPNFFAFNAETAKDNAFQSEPSMTQNEITSKAVAEFDEFVSRLRAKGIQITVIEDTPEPLTPDAVFPNNWFTTHPEGKVVLYPMKAENRRLERRTDILDQLAESLKLDEVQDFSKYEAENRFMEGTGSMIFDHDNKICYAAKSERTDKGVLEEITASLGYETVFFSSFDQNGGSIYHTNVMLSVGSKFAVLCDQSVTDAEELATLKASFEKTGRTLICVNFEQMNSFCCNILEVRNEKDELFVAMSDTAFNAFTEEQKAVINQSAEIIHAPLATIESIGGGGARCMMAEIFLPKK